MFTKTTYCVNVEFEDHTSDTEIFSELGEAKDYLAEFDNLIWFKIERDETAGGMIVSRDTVEEWEKPCSMGKNTDFGRI